MRKQLNYIFPQESAQVVSLNMNSDDQFFYSWLYSMMEAMPDVNWFFTVESTDIFED